jgi:tRNA nucleotidyltransferase (CCA-adding enzyme)
MMPTALCKSKAGANALRRFKLRVGQVDWLLRVCQADREGRQHPWTPQPFPEGEWIQSKLQDLGLERDKPRPILLGRDLIKAGVAPGPKMGELLHQLFEMQLEGLFETRDEGLKLLMSILHSEHQDTRSGSY